MKPKKSWQQKLRDNPGLPKVAPINEKMRRRWGMGTVVIPAPIEVNEIMRQVPEGNLNTINEIRAKLAYKHGATIGCPMASGIFTWVAAHAADEAARQGLPDITPYCRTLKSGGVLNEKYPTDIDNIKFLLEREGHRVILKGKKYLMVNYERFLVDA